MTHPRVSELYAVFRLTEVNFLFMWMAIVDCVAFIKRQRSRFRKGLDISCREPEHAYCACYVFHGLLTKIGESDRQFIPNLVVCGPRDTYSAGIAQRFQ